VFENDGQVLLKEIRKALDHVGIDVHH